MSEEFVILHTNVMNCDLSSKEGKQYLKLFGCTYMTQRL